MNVTFFREYLKNIRSVGAVAPSSRYLARKMVASIDFDSAKVIIEYGPGTGVFTSEIIKRKHPGTTLLVIETNETFYQKLVGKYADTPGVEIINASAEDIDSLHAVRKLSSPDYIISGLPFTALPASVSRKILTETAKLLGKRGQFITFQYTLVKKALFAKYFSNIAVTRELRNIPPAYVLTCKK
jgi:phosphatidylethanolamine/phosphatidyl-N-methylethanolamine N-methyltransferase